MMKKYKFVVLFKNGVEKTYEVEGEESDLDSVIATIKRVYKGESTGGILNIGFAFINICETACIDISEVIE